MIFGLLAMWTQYAYLEQLSVGITSLPGSQERGSLTKDAVSILLYQQAGQLLSDAIILSSLECVQACLLLGTYTLPIEASGSSYIYPILALKLAIQNGMHRQYSGTNMDDRRQYPI
ncbi:uncharacterized protein G6M90_00g066310 [Metarhizium brunneum]|uniref:Uncharacterized protein n=1 Tax=Metarhizium brunneum TaxID=500148 RepID=A0A7D5Z7J0_9HYPO